MLRRVTPAVRVLVVDDEENLRHLLELVLTRAGYAVSSVPNGREALARLGSVDVVLCDIRMPEMDGLAFLASLPEGAPPVVMMSAYGTIDTALEAMRQGEMRLVYVAPERLVMEEFLGSKEYDCR